MRYTLIRLHTHTCAHQCSLALGTWHLALVLAEAFQRTKVCEVAHFLLAAFLVAVLSVVVAAVVVVVVVTLTQFYER